MVRGDEETELLGLAGCGCLYDRFGCQLTLGAGPPQEWACERLIEQIVAKKLGSVAAMTANDPNDEELLRTVSQKTELPLGLRCRGHRGKLKME